MPINFLKTTNVIRAIVNQTNSYIKHYKQELLNYINKESHQIYRLSMVITCNISYLYGFGSFVTGKKMTSNKTKNGSFYDFIASIKDER